MYIYIYIYLYIYIYIYIINQNHFILPPLNHFDLSVDGEGWCFEHSLS